MALSINFCGSVADTGAALAYTCNTNLATPPADSLLIAVVIGTLASSPTDPTTGVTGHGQTYAALSLTANTISTTHAMSVWVAKASAPTADAVTATWSATNRTGCAILEFYVTGADLSGTAAQAIVQNPTTNGTSNNVTATNLLAAAGAAGNQALAFWCHLANQATTAGGGNWAEPANADVNFNSPATGLEAQVATTFDRSPAASWTTSSAYRVVALEIKASTSVNVTLSVSEQGAAAQTNPVSAHTQALTGQGLTSARGDLGTDTAWVSAPVGLEATTEQGTAAPQTDVPVVGQEAASESGTLAQDRLVAVAGQEVASELGTLTPAGVQPVFARVTWAEVEFPAPSGADRVAALSGQAATVQQGTFLIEHQQPQTGQEITAQAGDAQSTTQGTLEGLESAAAADAALGVLHDNALTGQEATAQRGEVSAQAAGYVTLIGQEATAQQGTLQVLHSNAVVGQEATTESGAVRADHSNAIAGQELAASEGAHQVDRSNALLGQEATVSEGDLTTSSQTNVTANLTGLEAATQRGDVASAHAQPQTGQAATGAQGAFALAHEQATTGAQAAVSDGAAQASHAQALAGAELSTDAGTVLQAQQGTLSGAEATTQPGSGAPALQVAATGQETTTAQGDLTVIQGADLSVNLSGQQAVVSGGELRPDHLLIVAGLPATAQAGVPQIYVQQRHAKIPYTLGPPNLFALAARRHNEQTARRNNVQTARRNNAQGARRTPS